MNNDAAGLCVSSRTRVCAELAGYVCRWVREAFPELDRLKTALEQRLPRKKLNRLLSYLATLKTLVLSPETSRFRGDDA